jgi:predicted MPP superfamily phosphohydrolase
MTSTSDSSHPESKLRQPYRRHSLVRRAAVRVCENGCRAFGVAAIYRHRWLARERLSIRTETVARPDLPRGLDGFRVAQLSDIHGGPFIRRGDLGPVVDSVLALAPHLVAITGDLITHTWRDVLHIADDLGRLRAAHGVWVVFGNHDYRGRREGEIVRVLEERGIGVLRNANVRVEVEGGTLAVVGIEDLEEAKVLDLRGARAGVRDEDWELVLCHNPRCAPVVARERCLAVMCGHTHGYQIDLPLARQAGPPHCGTRIDFGPTRLIVNRGLGAIGLPVRWGAPAEVVLLELERSAA